MSEKLISIKKLKIKKVYAVLACLLVIAMITGAVYLRNKKTAMEQQTVRTATVIRRSISSTLSSSGTITAKNTYSISSMAEGEVISADFEEGDRVEEGQVLYQIDSSSISSKLSNAESSVERSKKSYASAAADYDDAYSKLSGNTYKSVFSGYVKNIRVKEGQKISENTEIADLYSDEIMQAYIPFLSEDAAQITAGSTAVLYLSNTLEALEGTVISVAALEETESSGRIIRRVLVEVKNPGGLTGSMTATADINGFSSTGDGTFFATKDSTLTATGLSGNARITSVLIHEGDYINIGTPLLSLDSEDVKDILEGFEKTKDNAKSSLENAEDSLSSTMDNLNNYIITAPISGTVVRKNVKAGEKVQNSGSTTLAVIYDMSALSFEMSIDELDISNVEVGQRVAVTADAFEGESFEGVVTKVSMEGTSSNGVTNYPVTVTLTEYGGLLPGMNVNGVITLASVTDALVVPVDALQRNNVLYIKEATADAETQAALLKDSGEANKGQQNGSRAAVPDGFIRVEVTVGLSDTEYVEITSENISEGTEIYVSQSSVKSSSSDEGMMMGGMGRQGGMGMQGGAPSGGRASGGGQGGPMR